MNFVDQDNTTGRGDGTYSDVIKKINEDGVCPFCKDHLVKYHKKPLTERNFWWITDNMYPYSPTKHHRLLIHKEHISHISEISKEAWDELNEIVKDDSTTLDISGGTFIMRFGNTKYTGASVTHLHAHILQSNPDDPSYDKTKGLVMRIG